MNSTRRDFLKGCCAGALALGAGRAVGFYDPLRFKGGTAREVLVYLFLRGGIDGLHLVVPYSGPDRVAYEQKRGDFSIPTARLRPIAGTPWAWHPRAGGGVADAVNTSPKWLEWLYQQQRLAVIHGVGMPGTINRSHFDTQSFIELGTPGSKGTADGWIARLLGAEGDQAALLAPGIGFSGNRQTSLIGAESAITLANAQDFRVDGFHWSWNDDGGALAGYQPAHLRLLPLWQGDSTLERAGRAAAESLSYMRSIDFGLYHAIDNPDGYAPAGGAQYPSDGNGQTLGVQLRNLAQLIKRDVGLRVAAVDYGFWDTHEAQGMPNPGVANHWDPYGNLVEGLGRALEAFYRDLDAGGHMDRVTVVIQSEFGRRFKPNESDGTDHGYGNLMLALGNHVAGGQMHGVFPGLDDASLFEGQDVDATTDFRQVLCEALVDRLGIAPTVLPTLFPEFSYSAGSGVFVPG
jgi:uncharacterized protein (DUF1501 family)